MEAHEHPDLLDDQLLVDTRLENEQISPEETRPCCRHCLSVRHLVTLDDGFGFRYCHWCGNFQ